MRSFGHSKPLKLALVGCGGMGRRHLHGLARLENAGINPFALVAVCDPFAAAADAAADLTEELFGAPAGRLFRLGIDGEASTTRRRRHRYNSGHPPHRRRRRA